MDIKAACVDLLKGLYDSFKGMGVIFHFNKEYFKNKDQLRRPIKKDIRETTPQRSIDKNEESTVITRILQCGFLNGGIFLFSILFFNYAFMPGIKWFILFLLGSSPVGLTVCSRTEMLLNFTFQSIWVAPLLLITKCINNLWFQDIGQSAYKYRRGKSTTLLSLSATVADYIFSTVIETLFLVQALLMTYIPIYFFNNLLYWTHLGLLYSLYSFEYKWSEMGWELHKRLACIETHWPYFIGFGLPLVFLTQISDSLVINGCIFSILFPLFIISANEASPVFELSSPLQIFSVVTSMSNGLFKVLVSKSSKKPQQPPPQVPLYPNKHKNF